MNLEEFMNKIDMHVYIELGEENPFRDHPEPYHYAWTITIGSGSISGHASGTMTTPPPRAILYCVIHDIKTIMGQRPEYLSASFPYLKPELAQEAIDIVTSRVRFFKRHLTYDELEQLERLVMG